MIITSDIYNKYLTFSEPWQNQYFDYSEFDSKDKPGSGIYMSRLFVNKLTRIRELCNFPFFISSGFRTPEYNRKIGASPTSSHLLGIACDIRVNNSFERYKVVENALKCGVSRIGLANTFIHLDIDTDKIHGVIWLY